MAIGNVELTHDSVLWHSRQTKKESREEQRLSKVGTKLIRHKGLAIVRVYLLMESIYRCSK